MAASCELSTAPSFNVTNPEKELIRESWAAFSDGDIVERGSHMFIRMFEQRPDIIPLWNFGKDKDAPLKEIAQSSLFRAHVSKVMKTIGTIVDLLDNATKAKKLLNKLGTRHYKYGARTSHFQVVAEGLLYALKKGLGEKFTSYEKQAWESLFGFIQTEMTDGFSGV